MKTTHGPMNPELHGCVGPVSRYNDPVEWIPTTRVLGAAATPLVLGGLKTVILAAVRRRTARFSGRRHQASGMWSFAL